MPFENTRETLLSRGHNMETLGRNGSIVLSFKTPVCHTYSQLFLITFFERQIPRRTFFLFKSETNNLLMKFANTQPSLQKKNHHN